MRGNSSGLSDFGEQRKFRKHSLIEKATVSQVEDSGILLRTGPKNQHFDICAPPHVFKMLGNAAFINSTNILYTIPQLQSLPGISLAFL